MNAYNMNDNLEEVKRNRTALNIKIRFVSINEKVCIYSFGCCQVSSVL